MSGALHHAAHRASAIQSKLQTQDCACATASNAPARFLSIARTDSADINAENSTYAHTVHGLPPFSRIRIVAMMGVSPLAKMPEN
jgi:hypothetical protein